MSHLLIVILSLCVAAAAQSGWPGATPASANLDSTKFQAMEAAIKAGEFKKVGTVVVARHGKLVYEGYFDGDVNTLRDTRSVGKSFASILIGLAIQEKKLSGVDAHILDLLPERRRRMQNPDPRKDKITVEDFMTMSSVLECNDWNEYSRGNEERMYLIEDWAQFIFDLPVAGRTQTGEKPEAPKYGRFFSYCTGGVFVLSEVITRATGQRTDRYAQQKLFNPLSINPEHVVWVYSPLGVPMTGGGLRLRSVDLLKVAQMYLNGGKWDGKQIINEQWVQTTVTPHAKIDDQQEYGYNWWLGSFKTGAKSYAAFYMTGNGGNKVMAFPQLDMTVVITATNYGQRDMHKLTEKILTDYVLAAVENQGIGSNSKK